MCSLSFLFFFPRRLLVPLPTPPTLLTLPAFSSCSSSCAEQATRTRAPQNTLPRTSDVSLSVSYCGQRERESRHPPDSLGLFLSGSPSPFPPAQRSLAATYFVSGGELAESLERLTPGRAIATPRTRFMGGRFAARRPCAPRDGAENGILREPGVHFGDCSEGTLVCELR